MERKLSDRTETYTKIICGKCSCGEPVVKVEGSSCTMWVNGDRYHYPKDNTPSCIFRCKSCGEPIHETFNKEKISK